MLIRTVVAPLLGTNCYVVSDDELRTVVIDPGVGVAEEVVALVRDLGLRPIAVLATHGHVDHTWAGAAVCDALDVPFHLHRSDAHRLEDPWGTLGPLGAELSRLAGQLGQAYRAPARVHVFDDGAPLDLRDGDGGRFPVTAVHAPGHTPGSTVYLLDGEATAFTGDVLFAGTIGRTDLPGGDSATMTRTLGVLAGLDAATVVLPGHGDTTRIDTELVRNPYLRAST